VVARVRADRFIRVKIRTPEWLAPIADHMASLHHRPRTPDLDTARGLNQEAAGLVVEAGRLARRGVELSEQISAVAAQSNLLGLTAAIQADHAGEQGRGFVFVAEEMCRLAESSDGTARETEVTLHALAANIADLSACIQRMSVATAEGSVT